MSIIKIIDNFKKEQQKKFGFAIFDVKVKNTKTGLILEGEVLTNNQIDEFLEEFKKSKIKIKKKNIKVLADINKQNEIDWAIVKKKIIDLKSRFVSNKIINEKILKRIRCSQIFKDEILRVLYKNEDQLLVQQNDLSLGWVNRSEVVIKKKSLYKKCGVWKKWMQHFYTLGYRTKNKIFVGDTDKNKIIKEAEKYLGVPYLFGGKSKKGIDCSGFVQLVYKNSLDIILPKHSWDQKEMGHRIDLKNVKSGDLIFLVKKKSKHKHIGIIEKNKYQTKLLHASLDLKKVVKQNLDEVFENYNFVEARKIVR